MTKKPIGLLWDSVSNNTGDIAIGMFLKRFCEGRGIHYEQVDPFAFNPTKYSTFIIGGGQILRSADDIFYQSFHIPGPQILNSVGIHEPDHLEYLRDYRLVTVRSKAEKAILQSMVPDLNIEVCPCNTIRMKHYFGDEIAKSRAENRLDGEFIGIHLNNTTLRKLPGMFSALEQLSRNHRLLFIPFTHYENDRYLMETLSKLLPQSSVSTANDPLASFAVIGRLKAMISSSLHASMFAYTQNVPVLAFPQDYKLRYFFEERDLPGCIYDSSENLAPKLEQLLSNSPNYRQSLQLDEEIVDAHLEKMAQIINEPFEYEFKNPERFRQSEYNDLRRSFYTIVLQNLAEVNTRETHINELEYRLAIEQRNKVGLEPRPLAELPFRQRQSFLIRTFLFKLKRFKLFRNQYLAGLIRSSELFDKEWYLAHNPDVAASKIDPAWHYFIYGGFEGRDPSLYFSSEGYLNANPDVAAAGQNPLIHYLTCGQREGRSPKVLA